MLIRKRQIMRIGGTILCGFISFSMGCAHLSSQQVEKPLANPFAALAPKVRSIESKSKTCPQPPSPVVDVMSQTYYSDEHHSIIDPKKHKQSQEMVVPLRTFNNQVVRFADQIWEHDDRSSEDCLYAWLSAWAKADALLGNANYQGEFERKWNLSGIALAYLKVENLAHWNAEQKKSVVDWLEKIAQRVRSDYNQKLDRQSRRNNHIYWAGLSVMAAAIATRDRELYDWGLSKAYQGIKDVTAEGFLPEELDRARRARHYQSFALQALTMMAFLGKANGVDLYSLNDQALHRLAQKTMDGYQDSLIFEKATSVPQEPIDPKDFQWTVAYLYQNPQGLHFEKYALSKFRFSPWLGGDLAITFANHR